MGRKSNIDWERGRAMHVFDGISYSHIAQALNVTPRSVQRRAAKEGWHEERLRYIASKRSLTFSKALELSSDAIAQDTAQSQVHLAEAQQAAHQAIATAIDLAGKALAARQDHANTVTIEQAALLLDLALKALALWTQPIPETQGSNITNILIQLQSMGAQGRASAYRNLLD